MFDPAPKNIEAECATIGVLIMNPDLIEKMPALKPHHFYLQLNQIFFSKISELVNNSFNIGKEALITELFNFIINEYRIGEAPEKREKIHNSIKIHITNCMNASVNFAIPGTINYLIDLYVKRETIRTCKLAIDEITHGSKMSALKHIEKLDDDLFKLAHMGEIGPNFLNWEDLFNTALGQIEYNTKNRNSLAGITTGLIDVDSKLSGLQNSDLVIIAGRPSMGKTALAINMAVNAAHALKYDGKSVGFFSLEMSAQQLTTRIIAMSTGLNAFRLRTTSISQKEYDKIIEWEQDEMHKFPLKIDDSPCLTVSSIRARARKLARKHNVGIIFIDYLQLISSGEHRRFNNKVQEISAITQELKGLAKELNIPVVALSQLSRAVEQREDKRPMLSDLRESGSIEQDADVVMFIYREEYYTRRMQPKEGTPEHDKWRDNMNNIMNQAEIIIAKQRNGPIANVKVHYDSETQLFSNWFFDYKQ